MEQIGKNEYMIPLFGQKLMSASKSINKVPDEYFSYAQNARVYSNAIGPRKGYQKFIDSMLGAKNQGGFTIKNNLYQVTNGKIYKLSQDGNQEEVADLGHTNEIDVAVYNNELALIVSEGEKLKVYDGYTLAEPITGVIVKIRYAYLLGGEDIPEITRNATMIGAQSGAEGTVLEYDPTRSIISVTKSKDIDFIVGEGLKIVAPYGGQSYDKIEQITSLEYEYMNGGIVSIALNRAFVARGNTLYIGSYIHSKFINTVYKFSGTDTIMPLTFGSKIIGMQNSASGLYIFTEKGVELLDYDSFGIEYVYDGDTILTAKTKYIGDGGVLAGKKLVMLAGDGVYYFTKGHNISSIGFISGTASPGIGGDISSQPIIGMKDFLAELDENQENGFAFYNEKEGLLQFFVRGYGSNYNNVCVNYDLINNTWSIDTNRTYNQVLYYNGENYGFSDLNGDVYKDGYGNDDNGKPIDFKIITQNFNFQTLNEKLFQGFFVGGMIGSISELKIRVYVDFELVYEGEINGNNLAELKIPILYPNALLKQSLGMIGGTELGGSGVGGGKNSLEIDKYPFDMRADSGTINRAGDRIMLEISSNSVVANFLVDSLGICMTKLGFTNIGNKF